MSLYCLNNRDAKERCTKPYTNKDRSLCLNLQIPKEEQQATKYALRASINANSKSPHCLVVNYGEDDNPTRFFRTKKYGEDENQPKWQLFFHCLHHFGLVKILKFWQMEFVSFFNNTKNQDKDVLLEKFDECLDS